MAPDVHVRPGDGVRRARVAALTLQGVAELLGERSLRGGRLLHSFCLDRLGFDRAL